MTQRECVICWETHPEGPCPPFTGENYMSDDDSDWEKIAEFPINSALDDATPHCYECNRDLPPDLTPEQRIQCCECGKEICFDCTRFDFRYCGHLPVCLICAAAHGERLRPFMGDEWGWTYTDWEERVHHRVMQVLAQRHPDEWVGHTTYYDNPH